MAGVGERDGAMGAQSSSLPRIISDDDVLEDLFEFAETTGLGKRLRSVGGDLSTVANPKAQKIERTYALPAEPHRGTTLGHGDGVEEIADSCEWGFFHDIFNNLDDTATGAEEETAAAAAAAASAAATAAAATAAESPAPIDSAPASSLRRVIMQVVARDADLTPGRFKEQIVRAFLNAFGEAPVVVVKFLDDEQRYVGGTAAHAFRQAVQARARAAQQHGERGGVACFLQLALEAFKRTHGRAEALVVENATQHPLFRDHPFVVGAPHITLFASAILRLAPHSGRAGPAMPIGAVLLFLCPPVPGVSALTEISQRQVESQAAEATRMSALRCVCIVQRRRRGWADSAPRASANNGAASDGPSSVSTKHVVVGAGVGLTMCCGPRLFAVPRSI